MLNWCEMLTLNIHSFLMRRFGIDEISAVVTMLTLSSLIGFSAGVSITLLAQAMRSESKTTND